ncbi:MAG: TIGR01244 family phosphatase [Rhodobacteraceae bacterium]|nr:TIGR01244 family phosphatase [Paracoccaceae bacterium]
MFFNLFKSNKIIVGSMRVKEIQENFLVTSQITIADVADAKAAGFHTIICNRPDNESAGQPSANQIGRAAKKAGLKFFYVPMSHGGTAPETVPNFRKAVAAENGKILAYCRSGNRSSMLWRMAQK